MSEIRILNSSLVEQATIAHVVSCSKTEQINGDNTLSFTLALTSEISALINDTNVIGLGIDYFDIANYEKSQNGGSFPYVKVDCEHISYRLNNPEYDKEYFTEMGTPTQILTKVLEGTGFTVGTVNFTETLTYSAQEKKSRRALLMELVYLLGGEVSFDGFEVSILTQRGSTTPKDLTANKNVTVIGMRTDKRTNPATKYYNCDLINPVALALGDVVTLTYELLSISVTLRIVSLTSNPYDVTEVSFEVSNIVPSLEDDIYRIETNTVAKGKKYYGAKISADDGFESVRNDNLGRAVLNADLLAFQSRTSAEGSWINDLFYDAVEKRFRYNGLFSAEAIEAIKANIDIVVSNTIITQTLYAQKADIAELTVDRLDTSDKVQNYLKRNTDLTASIANVDYVQVYDQNVKFITAEYIGDLEYQTWTTYPASPELTADYPYQVIYDAGGSIRLICSTDKWYYYYSGDNQLKSTSAKMYQYNGSAWVYVSTATNFSYTTILQANADVYTNDTLAAVMFAATTTAAQFEQLKDRDLQNVYWVDGTHTGTTKEVTAFPVNVYKYTELVKLEISFQTIDGVQTPIITWGAGAGVEGHPTWGQAFDYKVSDGIIRKYIKETDGQEVIFKVGENGLEGFGVGTIFHDRNTEIKTVNTTESVVLTKDILFPYLAKTLIQATIIITVSAACNVTAKTYVDGNALTLQPTLYCGAAGSFILTYSDIAQYIAAGTKTIAVKLVTDVADGTVAIGQATLIIQSYTDTLPTFSNVTLFTVTPISATEIDLGWTNPVSSYFTEVEVYRSTTDISVMSRADCITNGSLIYSGTLEVYADTGLTAGTQYYYKVFAKYSVEGTTYYSTGTADSETTLVAPPPVLLSAATNTAGTAIALTFDKAMADPVGKHGHFSLTVEGIVKIFTSIILGTDITKLILSWSVNEYSIDVTDGQTFMATSIATSDYPANKAFDNNTGTLWYASGSIDQALIVDFGLVNLKVIRKLRLISSRLQNFVFEASNNYSNWTTIYSGTKTNVGGWHEFIFANSTAYRYYRIRCTGVLYSGSNVDIVEAEMMEYGSIIPIEAGQIVTVDYTEGDVLSSDGGKLVSFVGHSVVNNLPGAYQAWANYPLSPVMSVNYPYQLIQYCMQNNINKTILRVSTKPFYHLLSDSWNYTQTQGAAINYYYENNVWNQFAGWPATEFSLLAYNSSGLGNHTGLYECNYAVLTDSTLTTVYFNKTTP